MSFRVGFYVPPLETRGISRRTEICKLEELRDSFLEGDDTVGKAGLGGAGLQPVQGLMHGFIAEPESSIVHRNHFLRAELHKGAKSLLGIHVHVALGGRVVGSNREQGNFDVGSPPDV